MNESKNEIRTIGKMIHELASLAESASLTGTMEDGRARAVVRYNKAVERLQELKAIPDGMYEPIPESTKFGELAVEARLLAASLKGGTTDDDQMKLIMRLAPFASSEDLGEMLRKNLASCKCSDPKMMVALAPFLKKEDLGAMIQMYCCGEEFSVSCSCDCDCCKDGECCCGDDCACSAEEDCCKTEESSTEITSDVEAQVRDIARKLSDPATSAEDREALTRELSALSQRMV